MSASKKHSGRRLTRCAITWTLPNTSMVLGLIFLKYISDSFEEVYRQIISTEHYDGMEEDKDAYLAEGVFWVPQAARWEFIKTNAKKPDIGKLIDDAMVAIEKEK